MAETTVGCINVGKRKRGPLQRTNIRRETRHEKYADKDPLALTFNKPCKHKEKSDYKCELFNKRSIILNREHFYKNKGKIEQDLHLAHLIVPYIPKRNKKTPLKKQKFSCKYFSNQQGNSGNDEVDLTLCDCLEDDVEMKV